MLALTGYFAAVFVFTWSAWIAADRVEHAGVRAALILLGTLAPGIVAIALTGFAKGQEGVHALLRRLVQWDVPARWYVFAISYMAVIKLVVAVIHRVATGDWPAFGAEPWYLMIVATLVSTVVGGQAGEELGWRGYALPRMAEGMGLGAASVLLGVIWATWHLPIFFLFDADKTGQSFPLYLLQVTALSVAIAWLFAQTQGSLLLTMLMHAAVNNTKDIVPSVEANATNPWALSHSLVAWLTVALLWLCAAFFLVRFSSRAR